jgi:hypothetical protein
LYGYEPWSPVLKEEHGLRLLEKEVLRRIFGPNRDVIPGEWRELHSKELHSWYSLRNIVRVMKLGGKK